MNSASRDSLILLDHFISCSLFLFTSSILSYPSLLVHVHIALYWHPGVHQQQCTVPFADILVHQQQCTLPFADILVQQQLCLFVQTATSVQQAALCRLPQAAASCHSLYKQKLHRMIEDSSGALDPPLRLHRRTEDRSRRWTLPLGGCTGG